MSGQDHGRKGRRVNRTRQAKLSHVRIAGSAWSAREHRPEIAIDFQVLADGRMLELVARPKGGTGLLVWKDGQGKVVDRLEHDGHLYVPRLIPPGLATTLQLPIGVGPDVPLRELAAKTLARLQVFADVDVGDDGAAVLSIIHFILATWRADELLSAPYLLVLGPTGSGKTTLLKILSRLCRRSLLLGTLTPTDLCSLPLGMKPTLLLDETELTKEMCALLRAGYTAGVPVMRKGVALDLCCPIVIASREHLKDDALASRCIQIVMTPTKRDLVAADARRMQLLADDMQPKLLSWRLRSYGKTIEPSIKGAFSHARTRDIARVLAMTAGEGEQHQKYVAVLAKAQDRERQNERLGEPEYFIVQATLHSCHMGLPVVTIGRVTKWAESFARSQNETFPFNPRAVGPKLRVLGLPTGDLGRNGYGLYLNRSVYGRIHELARRYGLLPDDGTCAVCQRQVEHSQAESSGVKPEA